MEIRNKVIVITGASGGIGAALAERLASGGNTLYLIARRFDLLDTLKQRIQNSGNNIIPCICDVSDNASVTAVFSEILKHAGHVDIAILNAGIGRSNAVKVLDLPASEATFATNVLGVLYCINAVLPVMIQRNSGIIAGVSSMADVRGFAGSGVYSASKAALSTMLESFRAELRGSGIRVVTIRPGFVATDMTSRNKTPMPFIMSAERAAEIICRRIEAERNIISFPWQTNLLTRMLRFLPAPLFEFLSSVSYKKRRT